MPQTWVNFCVASPGQRMKISSYHGCAPPFRQLRVLGWGARVEGGAGGGDCLSVGGGEGRQPRVVRCQGGEGRRRLGIRWVAWELSLQGSKSATLLSCSCCWWRTEGHCLLNLRHKQPDVLLGSVSSSSTTITISKNLTMASIYSSLRASLWL